MRRRDFLKTAAGAGTFWSVAAYAQQSAIPVIGVLHGVAAAQWADRMVGFHKGLGEAAAIAALIAISLAPARMTVTFRLTRSVAMAGNRSN